MHKVFTMMKDLVRTIAIRFLRCQSVYESITNEMIDNKENHLLLHKTETGLNTLALARGQW